MGDVRIAFGKRVRQLRQMRDMTQQELAEASEMSISFLGCIERGKKSPTIDTLQKMAEALNVTLSELVAFDSDAKIAEDDKTAELHRLLSEYTDKIDRLYQR